MGLDSDDNIDSQAIPIPPRFWWLKRILIASGILLVVLVGLRWRWGVYAHNKLQAEIDRIIAAGEPIYPEDFDPEPVPDSQNAALLLEEAALALTLTAEQTKFFDELPRYTRISTEHLEQVGQIVQANQEALALAHQARSLPGADWGLRIRSPMINFMLPSLSSQKQLTKVLCLAASYHHHTGKDNTAIELIGDAIAQSKTLDQMPTLVSHLVAVGMDALAVNSIENITPDLNIFDIPNQRDPSVTPATRAQIKALIAELLDEVDLEQGLIWAMQCDRMVQLDWVQQFVDAKLGWAAMTFGGGGAPRLYEQLMIYLFGPIFELDGVLMMQHMNAIIQACKKSNLPTANKILGPLEIQAQQVRAGMNKYTRPLSRILLPSLEQAVLMHFRIMVQRRMAAIALAIRLYEIDHGRRPEKLADLVPDYLSEIPEDPFGADGQKISYLPKADRPILYSIGSNGKDDAGKYSDEPEVHVEWDKYDIPFFLNGDRPHRKAQSASSTQPTSSRSNEENGDIEDNQGNSNEDQTGQDQPDEG